MAAVTEPDYDDRVEIWRIKDLFDYHQLKVKLLMNGFEGRAILRCMQGDKIQGARIFIRELRARILVHVHP